MTTTPHLMDMMSKLIETPSVSSVSPSFDMGNRAVIDLLANWLDDLGFTVELQPLENHTDKANLIATLGQGEDGLVLAGHTDTVPCDESRWRFDPFSLTVSKDRLYGLGTSDMKSFLALVIEAASSFRDSDLQRPLTILATADEESTMDGAKLVSQRAQRLGRYCVIGEPTNLIPVHQHKGMFMEAIRLLGKSGHSSDPRLGKNALEGMHTVIQGLVDFRTELGEQHNNPVFDVPTPTLNLGHIHGGDNPNRICGKCELHLDLRPLPGMSIDELRQTLRDRVAGIAAELELECEFEALQHGIPALETPPDSPIVTLAEQLAGTKSVAVAFATEGPYLNQMGTETVVLGPGNIAQAHQPDEYLEIGRIKPTLDLLRQLIARTCSDALD